MKRFLLLMMILAMLVSTAACGSNDGVAGSQAEQAEEPVYVIEAGGLELKYPEKWKDQVSVVVSDDRAAFSCGDVQLFDIVFNSSEGKVLGTIRGEKNTVVSVVDYTLEQADENLMEMAMDVNVILQNLDRDYDFAIGEAVPEDTTATYEIETPVVTLMYPEKWKDKVTVDVAGDRVSFVSGETKLFDLVFAECDGYLLGTYSGTPIYIVDYPVTTDEEASMKQDVNVILQNLQQDSNFKIA